MPAAPRLASAFGWVHSVRTVRCRGAFARARPLGRALRLHADQLPRTIANRSSAIDRSSPRKARSLLNPNLTLTFPLDVRAWAEAASHTPYRPVMGLGLFVDDYPVSTYDHYQLVARFQLQGLARLAGDGNLILGGKSYLRQRFTFWPW